MKAISMSESAEANLFETCLDELSDKIYVVVQVTDWDSDDKCPNHEIVSSRMNRNEAIKYITDNEDIKKSIDEEDNNHTIVTQRYHIAKYNSPCKCELTRTQAGLLLRMVPEYITLTFEIDHITGEVTEIFPRINQ